MTRNRLYLLGMIGAIVAVLVLSWVLGVQPALQQARTNNSARAAAAVLNQTQVAKLGTLTADQRNLTKLRSELAGATAAIPAAPSLSSFLGELNGLQDRYYVKVTGYTGGDVQAFGAAAAGTAPATAASGATPSASASPAPASTQTSTAPTQVSATSPSGLFAIPVQVTATGGYDNLVGFVGALQSGSRLFAVNKVSIAPTQAGREFTATYGGFVYVLAMDGSAGR